MAALPTTIYYTIDDTNSAANTGGGSGQQNFPDFVATTAANAATVATLIATILQRNVRLVQKYGGAPPWTAYTPGAANLANTSVPSGTMAA
jgi:hypothetical protein